MNFTKFLKFVKIRFITSLVTAFESLEFAQLRIVLQLITLRQLANWNIGQLRTAAFATKRFLELGGDECDNINLMNFKINSFKICKNS